MKYRKDGCGHRKEDKNNKSKVKMECFAKFEYCSFLTFDF